MPNHHYTCERCRHEEDRIVAFARRDDQICRQIIEVEVEVFDKDEKTGELTKRIEKRRNPCEGKMLREEISPTPAMTFNWGDGTGTGRIN